MHSSLMSAPIPSKTLQQSKKPVLMEARLSVLTLLSTPIKLFLRNQQMCKWSANPCISAFRLQPKLKGWASSSKIAECGTRGILFTFSKIFVQMKLSTMTKSLQNSKQLICSSFRITLSSFLATMTKKLWKWVCCAQSISAFLAAVKYLKLLAFKQNLFDTVLHLRKSFHLLFYK